MHYPYTTLHSHQPLSPSLPFSSFLPSYLSSFQDPWRDLLTKRCYIARCRPGDNLSPLHFVNSFPRGAIRLPRPSTSRFYLSLSFSPSFTASPVFLSVTPYDHRSLSLFLLSSSYLVILRSVHDIHFVRIFRGGFQARKPPPSRGSTSGKRETSNGLALSCIPLFPLLLHLPIRSFPPLSLFLCFSVSLSFSLALHLFVSRPLLSPTTYCHHVFPPHSLFLSCDRSLSTPVPRVFPRPPKGGGPGDETDPTRISGAIEAN